MRSRFEKPWRMVFDPEFLYIQSGSVKCLNPAAGTAPAPVAEEKHFGKARIHGRGDVSLSFNEALNVRFFRTETLLKPMVS